ncbi:ubiquitin-like modifier-activating enzyme 6 [Ylistrum balloti]|uniref:ubiquitin-like modifier-activating enzyme 6 n=1 Tax=Ylistrum balloti TaxID=509963 RepID=UPI00290585E4|nr:ubiquitin-like modifier-activating enzyme 6 [Ylistrum balloti]
MAAEVEIDDSLYSRQRYVLGDNAMKRMANASVLVYGMGGLGIEIAKNIVLAGIKSLTIQDDKTATLSDLGVQFFLTEDDVVQGRNRAAASEGRLAELNPYVSINSLVTGMDNNTDLSYLTQYQCIILTEVPLQLQLRINQLCRTQSPPIQFISADVYGLVSSVFCDFGDEFEVMDVNGEELRDTFIENITKENPGVVTCLKDKFHGLETGDMVAFRELNGMTALNGMTCRVKVLSPSTFAICDTTGESFTPYEHGGIITQVRIPQKFSFKSLESQLKDPTLLTPDLSKISAPSNLHLAMLALHQYHQEQNDQLPNVWCQKDAARIVSLAHDINNKLTNKVEPLDEDLVRMLSFTARGCFVPLCAAVGGFVAQEGLKALTGKFTPLNQWLYLDAVDVISKKDISNPVQFQPRGDRYDALRICIGEGKCCQLANMKLFMVGCGAIGCEMLKNYALLGIASQDKGQITITDNDIIEKSNLNRQFLFRPHHIRKPKSTTAAQSANEINPAIRIEAQQHKVCPQTEADHYNDDFYGNQDLVVNALDNVEARRYVDSRCVTNQKALLESGTMGTKGHVQVIIPHLTESYGSQRDPVDEDIPYCTLKSFPAQIEHCIQWARDKFESSFAQKPALFNKFWTTQGQPQQVIDNLKQGSPLEGAIQISKILRGKPIDWGSCVVLARLKFEKYFNHKARHLLHHFPLDTRLKDGSLFWQSPKRPPIPQEFNVGDSIHLSFIISTAKLYATACQIPRSAQDETPSVISEILQSAEVPKYKPSSKSIVTDENVKKEADTSGDDDFVTAASRIEYAIQRAGTHDKVIKEMEVAEFEKDDDSNSHIDFITAAANLRAAMYSIDSADRLKVKRIAGRIVPAIATTTAAVAGLVSIELIKTLDQHPIENYKNGFLNLALPVIVLSEPGPAEKVVLKEGLSVTMWDRWDVQGNKDYTLKEFLQYFQTKFGFEATMVGHGVKMVYVPFMPGHSKRLPQTMVKLLKPSSRVRYVDLVVSLQGDSEEDIPGPPVRYFFNL